MRSSIEARMTRWAGKPSPRSADRMRILIIAHHFPPYDHIASARMGKSAKYLEQFGHDLRVIAARDALTPFARMPLEISAERVTYTPWLNQVLKADIALNRFAQRLSGKHDVLRTHDNVNVDTPRNRTRSRDQLIELGKSVRDALRSVLYFPDAQIGWFPFGLRAARRLFRSWRPDLIYASAGPPTALLIASSLSREYAIPWVAEFRDLWVENHRDQHPRWRRKIEGRLEHRIISTASGVVTVSEPLAEALRKNYDVEVEVVYNGFDPGDHGSGPSGSMTPWLEIRYTGWVYPQQNLAPLFQALQLLGEAAKCVRIVFYGSDTNFIAQLARKHGVAHLVEALPAVPFMDSLHLQRGADVLLYLSWNDTTQTGIFSGKLLQYFGARRPILAVGNTDNEPARVIRDRGLGFTSSESGGLAAQISKWITEKQRTNRISELPADSASEFSRENQARLLESFLARTLERAQGEAGRYIRSPVR